MASTMASHLVATLLRGLARAVRQGTRLGGLFRAGAGLGTDLVHGAGDLLDGCGLLRGSLGKGLARLGNLIRALVHLGRGLTHLADELVQLPAHALKRLAEGVRGPRPLARPR